MRTEASPTVTLPARERELTPPHAMKQAARSLGALPRAAGPRISLPFSERRLLLMVQDLLAITAALLLSLAFWSRPEVPWHDALQKRPHWFVLLAGLWLVFGYVAGAYDLHRSARLATAAVTVSRAGLLTVLAFLLVPYVSPGLPASRAALLGFPVLLVGLLVAGRALYVTAFSQPIFQRRVLIVGAGWAGRTMAEALLEEGSGTYQVLGFVDDDPAKLGQPVPIDGHPPLRVLGSRSDLADLVTQGRVTTVVSAITHEVNGALLQSIVDCLELGIEVLPMPVLYERLTGRVPVAHVGGHWSVAMPVDHPGTGALWPACKRLMDVVVAAGGLVVLGLALPFIALAIRLEGPGPIFYTQERVGQGGRPFRVYKFRSMVPNAENGRAVWATPNDSRVTRVGRLLRRSHLDELPQLLNILKGEMSVVGPRPERPEFVEELAREIPFYRVRHAVKPGCAGWALLNQGYGASKEACLLKLQYDLYYIKHQSPWLDGLIILRTIGHMLTLGGR